jgi:hypothetical protein
MGHDIDLKSMILDKNQDLLIDANLNASRELLTACIDHKDIRGCSS